jgi:Transposase zinc-binding domain
VLRPALEIADIFRDHGPAWRAANAGHVSLDQLKVMSAIEACRTARLGGTVVRCDACQYTQIQYCSCRNRHCPKCHVWTAPAVQEESDVVAIWSGAVMYSACCGGH